MVPNITIPRMNIMNAAVRKFRILSNCRSTIGFECLHSLMTNHASVTSEAASRNEIFFDENQSSS